MSYIPFGCGHKNLVMIPGLSDALKTVKGSAVVFAAAYSHVLQFLKTGH